MGRKVGIRPKRQDDWLVAPNLWGAIIGRPGVMKSPALAEVLKPIKRLEVEAKEDFERAMADFGTATVVDELRRKEHTREIVKALRAGGDADAVAAELIAGDTEEPVRRRYVINDTTVEKLGVLLNENPNGLLCFRDELVGLLTSLDRDGQEGARAFYLEAWNGVGRFTYDRIGRGTLDIEACCVSVIGGIQPGPLANYLRAAVKGGKGDDGLLQRFQLAVWPDIPPTWHNIDRWPDTEARDRAQAVYRQLDAMDVDSLSVERDGFDVEGVPYLSRVGRAICPTVPKPATDRELEDVQRTHRQRRPAWPRKRGPCHPPRINERSLLKLSWRDVTMEACSARTPNDPTGEPRQPERMKTEWASRSARMFLRHEFRRVSER